MIKLGKNNDENNKLSKKDIAIVALSAALFLLLVVIMIMSRRRDRMIAESLEQNSEISSDAVKNSNSSSMDNLIISEVNADNWLELYNAGAETIDISEAQIMVSGDVLASIENRTVLKKNDYLVVELKANPGNSDHNVLTIIDSKGESVKSMLVPRLSDGKSFGLAEMETNIWGYFEPSKGKANKKTDVKYMEDGGIGISAPGGFYSSSFDLYLDHAENEKIYYTTDGSTPTTDSKLYEDKIYITNKSGSKYVYARMATYSNFHTAYNPESIDCGMIVRAIKVDSAGNTTGELSQAFFVGLNKDSGYLGMPVLSITTDPDNLFDYEEGIYVAGKAKEDALIEGKEANYYANYYLPWKKPAKIEYFEASKGKTLELNADINIDTDPYSASVQKGLIISCNSDSYKEYVGSSIIDFISSDGKIKLSQNYEDNALKIRNYFVQELADECGLYIQKSQPCVIFLDGEYWGLYAIRSYLEESYFQKEYSLGNEEILLHTVYLPNNDYSDFYNFATQNDLSRQENYERVKTMLDIENFIDYVCFNVFIGNSLFWPSREAAFRTVTTGGAGIADGKWRFISGDISTSLYLTVKETPTINTFLQPGIQSDLLLQSLLMNEEFKSQFEIRMNKLITEVFDYEKCSEELDTLSELIMKPALASYERFFGRYTVGMYNTEIESIKTFIETRPEKLTVYTSELVEKGGDLAHAREILTEQESMDAESDENAQVDENTENGDNADNGENTETVEHTGNGENTETVERTGTGDNTENIEHTGNGNNTDNNENTEAQNNGEEVTEESEGNTND